MERLAADPRFDSDALLALQHRAQSLDPALTEHLSTEDYARFIVARCGDVEAALKQLQGACQHRASITQGADWQTCDLCAVDASAHSIMPVGVEGAEQSTIIYGCPARASNSGVEQTVLHFARQLEYCFALPQTGSRWVWCVDYAGFGMAHALQGRLAVQFATLFSNHMPERLHKILLIGPPRVFQIMLTAAKQFIDPVTMQKMVTLKGASPEEWLLELRAEHAFPDSTLTWLRTLWTECEATPESKQPALPKEVESLILPGVREHLLFDVAQMSCE